MTVPIIASIGWKSEFVLPKNTVVRAFAPPRGVSAEGNSLIARLIDTDRSVMQIEETGQGLYLLIRTRDAGNPQVSLFDLQPNSSVIDEFEVEVCEVERATGNTLNCQPFTVGIRVSRVS